MKEEKNKDENSLNATEDLSSDLSTNSVYRTLRILESLSVNQGKTLEELSPIVELSRPTLFRFLVILQKLGYVEKNQDNRYRLTPKLFVISSKSIEDVELTQIAKPYLEDMCFDMGETTILGILDGYSVLHLKKVESKYETRFYERVGKRNPLYCTTMGKILLSGMNEMDFSNYLQRERMIPYTKNTITDPEKLREVVESIRIQGYAESFSEFEQDIHSLACPVFDHDSKVVAAISINWPSFREVPGKTEECLTRLKAVAMQVSVLMGYVKPEPK